MARKKDLHGNVKILFHVQQTPARKGRQD